MTTPELMLTAGVAVTAASAALDQALPFGLMSLSPRVRMAMVLVLLFGMGVGAAGIAWNYLGAKSACAPAVWGEAKWGQ